MKTTKTTLLASLLFLGLFFVFSQTVNAEVIKNFTSTINVLPDSSILVNEKIEYDFETSIKHGIFRTIPLKSNLGTPIKVDVISVLDSNGGEHNFTTSTKNKVLTIQIGDADKMISGIKDYIISYQVWGSVSYYKDFDEIYWNVTGNDWQVAINKVETSVILPNNIFSTERSCYFGKAGSTTNCKITESNTFTPNTILVAGEGLTVAVGFPKGVVSVYQTEKESTTIKFVKTIWPIIIPIIVFVLAFLYWRKKGKDPKGTNVIIPQYDVPEGLTPLEVGGILNEGIKTKNISAEIIYLATKGYLKIRKIDKEEGNLLGLTSEDDYEFTLLKQAGYLKNSFDKEILDKIFGESGKVGGVARLSNLKNVFYRYVPEIDNSVIDILLEKKYYTNLPKYKITQQSLTVFLVLYILFFGFHFLQTGIGDDNFLRDIILFAAILVSVLIGLIFAHLMPAKSAKGVSIKEYLLGLREYLQIAEKDRIAFHNAPEKKPEIFESLLPYAMVFGVEKLWAKEFKDIYIKAPEWYDGGSTQFNIVNFGLEMAIFNTIATTSFSSDPNCGSGSTGGGFTGGGGGGGGGGSW